MITDSLDRAAFFLTFGATITDILGKYPNNTFRLNVPLWLSVYESLGGWVPYNAFCNQRRFVKRATRKLAGLPEYFTGHQDTKAKLGDFPVRPWRKGEAGWQVPRDKSD